MRLIRNFAGAFKNNVKNDVEHLQGQGAIEKADIIYNRIKALFSGTWNLMIDKIVDILLKSAKKDLRIIIRESKAAGIDPFTYVPDNVKDKLDRAYV